MLVINKPAGLAVQGGPGIRLSLDKVMGSALGFGSTEQLRYSLPFATAHTTVHAEPGWMCISPIVRPLPCGWVRPDKLNCHMLTAWA